MEASTTVRAEEFARQYAETPSTRFDSGISRPATTEDLALFRRDGCDGERRHQSQMQQARRKARQAWNACSDLKLLASRLGIAKVEAVLTPSEESEELGHYTPPSYVWGSTFTGKVNPAIQVNVLSAHLFGHVDDCVPGVLAHEIGHHIDVLAYGWHSNGEPNSEFVAAFDRAGFWAAPATHCELIAETLGNYLRGHELNDVLLAEVGKVLDKLPGKYANIVKGFRCSQKGRAN